MQSNLRTRLESLVPEFAGATSDVVDRLLVKWDTAKDLVPGPVFRKAGKHTDYGIIAFGSSHGAVVEAIDALEADGIHADCMRLRAFPFNDEVKAFIDAHDTIFVVEQNRDAQMRSLLMLELDAPADKLVPVLHYNGLPIPCDCIVEALREHIAKEAAA